MTCKPWAKPGRVHELLGLDISRSILHISRSILRQQHALFELRFPAQVYHIAQSHPAHFVGCTT